MTKVGGLQSAVGSKASLRTAYGLLLTACLACGCRTGYLPDPNDPSNPGVIDAEVLRTNVQSAAENIFARVGKGEITDAEARELLRQYADKMLAEVKPSEVDPSTAWEYAEVMRTAERWEDAHELLQVAVKNATSWDRKVNDGLRLAQVEAKLGRIDAAMASARKTFAAPAADKVPILPAILFEVAPAAQGKGKDAEVAKLLVEAVEQSAQAKVDAKSEAGKLFLAARPVHQRRAIVLASDLYQAAGMPEEARRASEALLFAGSKQG